MAEVAKFRGRLVGMPRGPAGCAPTTATASAARMQEMTTTTPELGGGKPEEYVLKLEDISNGPEHKAWIEMERAQTEEALPPDDGGNLSRMEEIYREPPPMN